MLQTGMQQSGALCVEMMEKALSFIEHLLRANFMLLSFCQTWDSMSIR